MSEGRARRWARAGTVAAVVALTACGDARIGNLTAGISRDSVLKILAQGGDATDSLPHVYREDRYLAHGRSVDVLFYTTTNLKAPAAAATGQVPEAGPVPEKSLTPIVLQDDRVVAWGWSSYDSAAKAAGFAIRPR